MEARRYLQTICWLVGGVLVSCGARTGLGARGSADASSDAAADVAPDAPDDCGASLASGPSWQTPFGPAQDVCLTPTTPPSCPSGAFVYGGSVGWSADISGLGGASWVWRPGIAASDPADGVEVTFTRTFVLGGKPSGTLSIAADDFAEVRVNGVSVGTVGSTSDKSAASAAQSALTTFDLTPHLAAGENTITVIGQNGPSWFAGCSGPCTYAQNFAGVVFGGRVDCH